jgi:hypothetical protein
MRVGGPIAGVPVERIAEQVRTTANALEMSIKNCTIFPIYLCTVFSVYFFNLDSADAVLYEFPKILTILE